MQALLLSSYAARFSTAERAKSQTPSLKTDSQVILLLAARQHAQSSKRRGFAVMFYLIRSI
jgi:hypothetical protein